jgi:hypothetical protein
MAVGIESEKVAESPDGDDGAGDGVRLLHRLPKKELRGFPSTAIQIGKKIPVKEKVPAQDLRDAEDEMPAQSWPVGAKFTDKGGMNGVTAL